MYWTCMHASNKAFELEALQYEDDNIWLDA